MKETRRYAQIVGWGRYVPAKILTNEDLARMVDTSDEWITSRTGIKERRVAASRESASTMAIRAAEKALEVADCDPTELDLVIVATATPDYLFPATACLVQDALGARRAGAFDLAAGCSGFAYGLGIAADGIIAGSYQTALVIGTEALSRIVDWTDRSTCVLFGDGAGAVVLRATSVPCGVLSTVLGADGSGAELLIFPGSGFREPVTPESRNGGVPKVYMNGHEIYRFATRTMAHATQQAIGKAGLTLDQIDLVIPHQANLRIIESVAKNLRLPGDKMFVNLERYGNTSAASIPIALCEAIESGRVRANANIVLVAFGAGLTWAASVVRWTPGLRPRRPVWFRFFMWLRLRLAPFRSLFRRATRRVDAVIGDATGDKEQ